MTWVTILLQIIPIVFKIIQTAETLFADIPKSGPQKKEFSMAAIRGLVESLAGTKFSDTLWTKIETAVSVLIDLGVAVLFPHEEV